MNELHLFAGAGGGILGGELLGIRTVCAVELEPYPASVLLARQNDGILPPFPVWDDVCTFDGRLWRGLVDVVSGGFPCQDISAAGKGAGIDGSRSGLWREMRRIINEVRPKFAFLENSSLLVGRGLARVLGDLAEIGYDAEWLVLGADDVGAPHVRKRIWILGMDRNADCIREEEKRKVSGGQQAAQSTRVCGDVANPELPGLERLRPLPGQTEIAEPGNDSLHVPDSNSQLRRQGKQPQDGKETDNCGFTVSDTPHPGNVRRDRQFPEIEIPGSSGDCHDGRTETDDCGKWWSAEPDVGRVAHGVAARVDRLKAIGNGQVPAVAATAFRILLGRFQEGKEGE